MPILHAAAGLAAFAAVTVLLPASVARADGWLDPEGDTYRAALGDPDERREYRFRERERLRREAADDAWYDGLGGHVGVDALSFGFESSDDSVRRPDVPGGHFADGEEIEPVGVRLRIGGAIEDFLDAELHGALARDDGGRDERLDLGLIGAYLKLKLPVGDYISLTALGGVTGVRFERSVDDRVLAEDDRSSLSYGAGIELALGQRTDIVASWTRYLVEDGDDPALDALGAGIRIAFR